MTATERLRELLDERGVGWWNQTDPEPQTVTMARLGEQLIEYHENVNGTMGYHVWNMCDLTPEQAIAATLGAGTCQDLGGTGANDEQVFNCSECGCVLSLYDRDGSNNLCTSFIYDYPRYCPECGRRIEVNDG